LGNLKKERFCPNSQGRTPLLRASVTSTCSSAALPAAVPPTTASKQQQLVRGSSAGHNLSRGAAHISCACAGRPRVCGACLDLPHMHAARAGTPGFRPPEVLLKHAGQTMAVDLWAVGVMLLCILSRSYPFFRAPDDMTALAELTTLFGTKNVREVAKRYGRRLVTSLDAQPKNLGLLCRWGIEPCHTVNVHNGKVADPHSFHPDPDPSF
jgi:cell division control protein 7